MRRSFWVADVILVAGMVLLAAFAFLLDALGDQRLQSGPRILVGILLAIAPACLWLVFFYRRDRVEPEPKYLVAWVAVAAALGATAVSEPLLDLAPNPEGVAHWVVAILVVGMVREFVKYLSVRLVAVPAGEVDERADGIVYGTAAGLGYAVALNIGFIVDVSGPALASGFAWITVVTLVHAALGGVVGLFCALGRLGIVSSWLVTGGLLLAAVLDGVFFETRAILANALLVPGSQGTAVSWLGIGLAVAVAVGITAVLTRLMRKEEATT